MRAVLPVNSDVETVGMFLLLFGRCIRCRAHADDLEYARLVFSPVIMNLFSIVNDEATWRNRLCRRHIILGARIDPPGSRDHRNVTIIGMKMRSEERRVGKECRSRWSPYH